MTKRKTDTEFKKEVYDLVGDEYTFLDPYQGTHANIKVKHNKCGHTYKVAPSNFLCGKRCPYCYGKMKKTDYQFKQEVKNLVGNEYIFLDVYVKGSTKIRVKHTKCEHTYKVAPNAFLRGRRCPYCSSSAKKTDAQFKQEVYNLVGDEYVFLDSYTNARTKLRVKHNKCGQIYTVKPSHFLDGTRCPYCAKLSLSNKLAKSDNQFKQEVKNLVGNEYTFIDKYVNATTKLRVKHNKCGKVYKVLPSNFLSGTHCPFCNGNAKKTEEQFKKEVFDLVGNEYMVLGSYVNTNTKIKVKHNACGTVYEVRPHTFLEGYRCPYCNSPKGETIITKILDTLNINYEPQKTFDDLKDIQPLSYDFFVPSQGILIEYQGQQHYEPVDHFGGEGRFKVQRKHDKLKADYAKGNGYKLITVPYTEDNFSKIKKYLLQHGLTK